MWSYSVGMLSRKRRLSALGLEGMKYSAFRIRRLVEVRRMTMPAKLVEELCIDIGSMWTYWVL